MGEYLGFDREDVFTLKLALSYNFTIETLNNIGHLNIYYGKRENNIPIKSFYFNDKIENWL